MAEPIQTDASADVIMAESSDLKPEPSTSSPPRTNGKSQQASVADEEQELKAEINGVEGGVYGDTEMTHESNNNGENGKSSETKVDPPPEVEVDDPNKIPDDACETLYLQNLNEKVRLQVLKETLASLFRPYKVVLPIIAHRNVRMRGQAFVTFPDKELANKARKDVSDFPLYGRAIQISFAKTRSDVAVKRIEGDERLEEHKKERLELKKVKRRNNPLRQKAQAKLKADESSTAPAKRQRIQMPDEYLPPNNVLFIQNLPTGTTSDDLREVFEIHPGLVEIRTIPAKKDIAFIEFADEALATVAKDALHNFKIDGETKMKVTYARK